MILGSHGSPEGESIPNGVGCKTNRGSGLLAASKHHSNKSQVAQARMFSVNVLQGKMCDACPLNKKKTKIFFRGCSESLLEWRSTRLGLRGVPI